MSDLPPPPAPEPPDEPVHPPTSPEALRALMDSARRDVQAAWGRVRGWSWP